MSWTKLSLKTNDANVARSGKSIYKSLDEVYKNNKIYKVLKR